MSIPQYSPLGPGLDAMQTVPHWKSHLHRSRCITENGCRLCVRSVPPFFGDSQKELYRRIAEGDFRFPPPKSAADPPFTKLARDLIQGLLEVDPARRLGSGPRGWGDVQAHPWFAGVAWDAVAKRGLQPPLVPPVYHHRKPAKYIDPLEVYRWGPKARLTGNPWQRTERARMCEALSNPSAESAV